MKFQLMDTNVVSELKKGGKMDLRVRAWFNATPANSLFLSVMTLGDIRHGIENKRLKDPRQAEGLERWMQKLLAQFHGHILPVTLKIADCWGSLCPGQKLPEMDGLQAATALVHGMTMVTRNVKDFQRSGVPVLNPWEYAG